MTRPEPSLQTFTCGQCAQNIAENERLRTERKRMVQDINDMHASPVAQFVRCVCGRLHDSGRMCPTEGCNMGEDE